MPHVEGELWELGLHVLTASIPTHERLNREAMPHILHSRAASLSVAHTGQIKQGIYALSEPRSGIAMASCATVGRMTVAQQRRCRLAIVGFSQALA
jgi:hypothetical protein